MNIVACCQPRFTLLLPLLICKHKKTKLQLLLGRDGVQKHCLLILAFILSLLHLKHFFFLTSESGHVQSSICFHSAGLFLARLCFPIPTTWWYLITHDLWCHWPLGAPILPRYRLPSPSTSRPLTCPVGCPPASLICCMEDVKRQVLLLFLACRF